MLNVARARAYDEGLNSNILWLCQDMTEFELYGTVDVCVCCLDTLNHLTDKKDLEKCLSLVHNYVIPDGLFIFDINGMYKFENVYSDLTYAMEEEGAMCVWQNCYDAKKKLCDFYITLFKEGEDGRYDRYDDLETERMYTLSEMKKALCKCGFEFVGAYSDFEFSDACDDSERIYIVARIKK